MAKKAVLQVRDITIRTLLLNGIDYICITDIARQKNPIEPKDVVKNWMRLKNTLEYLGLWEKLNNPDFKGGEFDPLLTEAGSNAFTMSPTRWVETTGAIGIVSKNGAGGGTYAQRDIAFKFASWVSVEFELYLVKEFQRLKGNVRDYAGINELICLSNMENLNAVFINDGLPQHERLIRLNRIAIQQMQLLEDVNKKYLK